MPEKKKLEERDLLLEIDKSVLQGLTGLQANTDAFSQALKNHIEKMLKSPEDTSWVSITNNTSTTAFVIYGRNYYDFIETDVKLVPLEKLK